MTDIVAAFERLQILQFGRGPGMSEEWLYLPISRAEFSVLVVRALGWDEGALEADAPFSDLGQHWASKYVGALAQEGIVKGEPDGAFRPNAVITLAEARIILARTLRAGTSSGVENADSALRSIGMDTSLPCEREAVNRGQAVMMLDRAMGISLYARHTKP